MAAKSGLEWCSVHEAILDHFYDVERFFSALNIWLERPQVLNRRLSGCHVLQSFQIDENVDDLLKLVYALTQKREPFALEELLTCKNTATGALPRDSSLQENAIEVQIRKLLPRQSDKFKSVTEFVVQDRVKRSVVFLPFEDKTSTEIVSKIDQAYKVSLILEHEDKLQGLTLSVLSDRGNGNGITCPTIEWLKSCLLPKLHKWMQDDDLTVTGLGKSLRLVPVDKYTKKYEELKNKYKHFVKLWPERTDPFKFVYEDVAIATYLLLLWEGSEHDGVGSRKVQRFLDLGCGNGLLVYILTNEGHIGEGIDLRPRKVWAFYDNKANLQVTSLDPSGLTYPNVDWIIGNHCDELTPWIPVIAARSSYKCNYFVLPCCFYEFYHKFQRVSASNSQYRSYLNYIQTVGETCGFEVKEDVLRIPSTKKVCQVGQRRQYSPDEQSYIEGKIATMLQQTSKQLLTKDNMITCDVKNIDDSKLCYSDTDRVNQDSETISNTDHCQQPGSAEESSSFVPRCDVEPVKNCTQLDKQLLDSIVQKVARELLSKTEACKPLPESLDPHTKAWNKGGSIKLSEVSQMFDQKVLNQLRSEAGGIKTVLRNCHQVFKVQHGTVEIRDWREESHAKDGGKNKTQSCSTHKYWKTKPCWFYDHHPDGCPLNDGQCTFAHGRNNLKLPPTKI